MLYKETVLKKYTVFNTLFPIVILLLRLQNQRTCVRKPAIQRGGTSVFGTCAVHREDRQAKQWFRNADHDQLL